MDNPRNGEISYGNLGSGSYGVQDQIWHFPRNNDDDTRLYVVESHKIFPASRRREHRDTILQNQSERLRPSVLRTRKVNALLSTFPEIIPGATILPQLEQVSEAINNVTSVHDPLASDYLSYGLIDHENSQNPRHLLFKRVLASVTGISRHVVRLSLVTEARHTAEQGPQGTSFMIDQYHREHDVFWRGRDQTPIQQICFSNNVEGSSFLGVRRRTRIEILRPILRTWSVHTKQPLVSEIGTGEHPQTSGLDPNWLLDISSNYFYDLPILQLAFHPQKSTELAVINAHGQVILFRIERLQTDRGRWTVSHSAKLDLSLGTHGRIVSDLWASIAWSQDGNLILTAQRNALIIHNSTKPMLLPIELLESSRRNKVCILDLHGGREKTGFVFVLTTTNIVAIGPVAETDELVRGHSGSSLKILLSVFHHRDPNDMSLRLSIEDCGHCIFVLIYSHLVPLVTGYKIELTREGETFNYVTDPFRLILPRFKATQHGEYGRNDSVHDNGFLCLKMRHASPEATGDEILSDGTLLHIVALESNLEVLQMIVVTQKPDTLPYRLTLAPSLPQHASLELEETASDEDDFVVEGIEVFEDKRIHAPIQNKHLLRRRQMSTPIYKAFTSLGNDLNNDLIVSLARSKPMESLEIALKSIQNNREDMGAGVHTLVDLFPELLEVDTNDSVFDKTVELLDHLIKTTENAQTSMADIEDGFGRVDPKIVSHNLLIGRILRDLKGGKATGGVMLTPIYESLLRKYAQVPRSEVLSKANVWLDRIIKRAAMQLLLSSRGIQPFSTQDTVSIGRTQSPTPEATGLQQAFLPMRTKSTKSTIGSFSDRVGLEEGVRTASQSRSPGTDPGYDSSSQQSVRDETDPERLIGVTLADYIKFQADSQLHRSLRRAVPEWHVGVTPTGQEWRSLTRSASEENSASAHGSKRRKNAKGKDSTQTTKSLASMRDSESFGVPDIIKRESRQSTAFDLDSYRQHSQTLLPTSSQDTARLHEPSQAAALSSQSLLRHDSQLVSQELQRQVTQSRSSKKPQSRKRPLGFR